VWSHGSHSTGTVKAKAGDGLATAWRWPGGDLAAAWRRPGDGLATAWRRPGENPRLEQMAVSCTRDDTSDRKVASRARRTTTFENVFFV